MGENVHESVVVIVSEEKKKSADKFLQMGQEQRNVVEKFFSNFDVWEIYFPTKFRKYFIFHHYYGMYIQLYTLLSVQTRTLNVTFSSAAFADSLQYATGNNTMYVGMTII